MISTNHILPNIITYFIFSLDLWSTVNILFMAPCFVTLLSLDSVSNSKSVGSIEILLLMHALSSAK